MLSFQTKVYGYDYEVTVRIYNDVPEYHWMDKKFDKFEKVEAAVKAYDLGLRKNFSNNVAYRMEGYRGPGKVEQVEVTSVVDEKEAWIKTTTGRQKVSRISLFTSRQEVEKAVATEAKCDAETRTAWEAVERWTPQA